MKKRKMKGIEQLNRRYGRIFVAPWVIGMLMFYIIPLGQSFLFSMNDVNVFDGGIDLKFVGLARYKGLLFADAGYTTMIKDALTSFLYSFPVIILLSLVLALLLNQKFKRRLFFRAMYFLPVIISTGVVINLLFKTTSSDLSNIGVSEGYTANMIDVNDIIERLGITGNIGEYISVTISKIFDLVWNCGIQTVLFIAGLQSVPASLYEASRVEGATKWEEFWFITFPSLSRVTLLVAVFTMVELITDTQVFLVSNIYNSMRAGVYDRPSTMMWLYFMIAGGMMGILIFLYNRFLMKRWEA